MTRFKVGDYITFDPVDDAVRLVTEVDDWDCTYAVFVGKVNTDEYTFSWEELDETGIRLLTPLELAMK